MSRNGMEWYGVRLVRITHVETGITAECWEHKSWHKNAAVALRMLRARLWAHYHPVETEVIKTYHTSGWGTWTKDHRCGTRINGLFMGKSICGSPNSKNESQKDWRVVDEAQRKDI